jgi:hypothetical protein
MAAQPNVSAALAGARVTVSPAPASRAASPQTQISFLGVPRPELKKVRVSGSLSGTHRGRLLPYSQHDGASFVPSTPFAPGERVTVQATLVAAGTDQSFSWTFTTAEPDSAAVAGAGTPVPPGKPSDYQHFVSRPDLQPPRVTIRSFSPSALQQDIMLTPYAGPGQYGPMILDPAGGLVYFKPLPHGARAANLRVQQYDGRPVLTWWQDPVAADGLNGEGIVIMSETYQQLKVVRAGNGYGPDLHEFDITPQDTALLTAYTAVRCDLASVGGPADGAVVDTLVQELDLRTGLVRFEWHSIDHVPLTDSYAQPMPGSLKTPFDYFHINSIEPEQDGTLLVNARNTWTTYDLSAQTGQITWQLGGKRSSFHLAPGAGAAWQHDAHELPGHLLTLFDNGATPAIHPQSRALVLQLNLAARTVALLHAYEHPGSPLSSDSQGNFQALPTGDWMIGWGQLPDFTELASNGQTLLDAHLPAGYESYRDLSFPWSGTPPTPPALVIQRGATAGVATAYMSWNGAADVASWRLLSVGDHPAPIAGAPRTGFETAIAVPDTHAALEAQALSATGAVLGTSTPVRPA